MSTFERFKRSNCIIESNLLIQSNDMVGYFYSYIVNADDIFLKNRDMAGEREKRDGFQYVFRRDAAKKFRNLKILLWLHVLF